MTSVISRTCKQHGITANSDVPLQGQVQPYPSTELRHMLDLCLYFIPAHRLKVCS